MSASYNFNQSYGSDDEEPAQPSYSGRDATIFVIDCNASMFIQSSNDVSDEITCIFEKCLTVLERLMLDKIISSKDLLGVVLYNTEHSPEPNNDQTENPLPVPKNCAILFPLKQIESNTIVSVKSMKASPDFNDFDNKYGHSTDAKIADVLWLCSSMFSSCGKQIRVPQIMWFTNEDSPHADGSSEHQQAFQKAKDLQQLQLDLQFYPMKVDFDGDLFYKELICQLLDLDLDEYQFPKAEANERFMLQRMFRRGYKKRSLAHLMVELTDKAKFGVGIYSFTRKSQVPKPVRLARDTKQEIVAKRLYKVATVPEEENLPFEEPPELDFKEKLDVSMALKVQTCGGEKIKFTPLEAYEIKQVAEPKIKILGFKPSSLLSVHNHIKCPYFVYPNDSQIKNSTVFFRALWERCLADDKVIICTMTQRLKSYPRLVALVPQQQQEGDGDMIRFDGFRMDFIPFAGDIRDLSDLMREVELDADITGAMKKIVGRLRIKFSPATFENPLVKKIYTKIEENVYNDEEFDEELLKDSTMPDIEAQNDRIDQFVDVLDSLVDGFDAPAAPKRKAESAAGESKRKKVDPEDINAEFILQKCLEGDVKALTVPVLKTYLELKKVSGLSKLNKGQLVEQIVNLAE